MAFGEVLQGELTNFYDFITKAYEFFDSDETRFLCRLP